MAAMAVETHRQTGRDIVCEAPAGRDFGEALESGPPESCDIGADWGQEWWQGCDRVRTERDRDRVADWIPLAQVP